ncbi:MAG TPA: restriction endonuclease [Solirubrobacterales bacterium]|nr:restriction endonuclease [Solirubrobacterales bacterium]
MPDIDNQRISGYFAHGDGTKDPFEKGRALENLIAYLFELIPGMFVTARNTMDVGGAQEIDIAFWNEGHPEGLRLFDYVLLVECKNWSEPVGHAELAVFSDKLRSRGRPQGILVAANGITGDPALLSRAHRQLSRALEEGREILVLTRAEIEALEDTEQLVVLLKRKRALLAVSGTSIQ